LPGGKSLDLAVDVVDAVGDAKLLPPLHKLDGVGELFKFSGDVVEQSSGVVGDCNHSL
jgi:hypothetical protein